MTATDILLFDLGDDGVLRFTLNDVARRNALSEEMLGALGTAIADAGENPAVRVIILAANGPAFCAGHDLKEMTAGRANADGGKEYFTKVMSLCSGVMQGIVNCPRPVIAEVTGVATAAIIGTHVCLRQVRAEPIWNALSDENDPPMRCADRHVAADLSTYGRPAYAGSQCAIFHRRCTTP